MTVGSPYGFSRISPVVRTDITIIQINGTMTTRVKASSTTVSRVILIRRSQIDTRISRLLATEIEDMDISLILVDDKFDLQL
jgi:hypothetical protein